MRLSATHQEQTQKFKEATYDAYTYMVFMFWCSLGAYMILDVSFHTLVRYMHSGIYVSVIYNGLKLVRWPRFRERVARTVGGIEAYHVSQAWNIILFFAYTLMLVSLTYALIIKEASWKSYGWVLLMSILVIHSIYDICNTYKKRYKRTIESRKKRKELRLAEAALDRADKNLRKLHNEKEEFQSKIENKIKENPECPEAEIDKLMAEFDRHDSRIRMAEQIKQNLEGPVTILRNELQDIQNNNPDAPENLARLQVGRHGRGRVFGHGQRMAETARQFGIHADQMQRHDRAITLLQTRIRYLQDVLTRLQQVQVNLNTQVTNLQPMNADQIERIEQKRQAINNLFVSLTERSNHYIALANAIIANPNDQNAFEAITQPDTTFIRLQESIAEFGREETALELNIVSANFIAVLNEEERNQEQIQEFLDMDEAVRQAIEGFDDIDEDDHMGTDGYPICPHCDREHNFEGGHQHAPYCSEDCKFADTHCAICRKEMNSDEAIGWTCSVECNDEYHRRQGNGE